jgi:hypothetical protein
LICVDFIPTLNRRTKYENNNYLLFVLFAAFTIRAQDALVVSGGNASGAEE